MADYVYSVNEKHKRKVEILADWQYSGGGLRKFLSAFVKAYPELDKRNGNLGRKSLHVIRLVSRKPHAKLWLWSMRNFHRIETDFLTSYYMLEGFISDSMGDNNALATVASVVNGRNRRLPEGRYLLLRMHYKDGDGPFLGGYPNEEE